VGRYWGVSDRSAFVVTSGFGGAVLPPVPFRDALHRVCAYCTEVGSGWATYDLCGVDARLAGQFETVSPWSLLVADALAGRVQVRDIAGFDLSHRIEFANRLNAIPPSTDLDELDASGRASVTSLCQFGYSGAWAPKITKVAALYRPQAVPVLDGYVALAFGLGREGFSQGRETRWRRIGRVVDSLSATLATHRELLGLLRQDAVDLVPDLALIPDLRLLDIIIWTAQDDRMTRPGKPANYWLNSDLAGRQPVTRDQIAPVSLSSGEPLHRDLPPDCPHWPPPPPELEAVYDAPPLRWVQIDLRRLHYTPWREGPWYDRVPWASVMEVLRKHVVVGSEVERSLEDSLPDGLPPLVQEGVWSLFVEPLGLGPDGHPIGGGHRMLAMRRQGLTHAYGME
jgi:Family of unknown function (DUF6308)